MFIPPLWDGKILIATVLPQNEKPTARLAARTGGENCKKTSHIDVLAMGFPAMIQL